MEVVFCNTRLGWEIVKLRVIAVVLVTFLLNTKLGLGIVKSRVLADVEGKFLLNSIRS